MNKVFLAGIAALAIAGSSVAYAQHHHWHEHARMSPEDRAAFADARIAAVHAGLKLTPDQENGRECGARFRENASRSRQCADEGEGGGFKG